MTFLNPLHHHHHHHHVPSAFQLKCNTTSSEGVSICKGYIGQPLQRITPHDGYLFSPRFLLLLLLWRECALTRAAVIGSNARARRPRDSPRLKITLLQLLAILYETDRMRRWENTSVQLSSDRIGGSLFLSFLFFFFFFLNSRVTGGLQTEKRGWRGGRKRERERERERKNPKQTQSRLLPLCVSELKNTSVVDYSEDIALEPWAGGQSYGWVAGALVCRPVWK